MQIIHVTPIVMSLPHAASKDDLKEELDLVPTKMCSVEPDPALFLTPEKPPSLLKREKQKLSNLSTEQKCSAKNRVRFNLPDLSSNTSSESFVASSHNTATDVSSASTEFEESSSNTVSDNTADFSIKAALYTQRNPLADITYESNHNFDTSASSITDGTSASTFSELPSTDVVTNRACEPKVVDLRASTKKNNVTPCNIIDIAANRSVPVYKTKLLKTYGHRKKTPAQAKIDDITIIEDKGSEIQEGESSASFLKKKSGLQRHEHSVQYLQLKDKLEQALDEPKYNSSLFAGQQLQVKYILLCVNISYVV